MKILLIVLAVGILGTLGVWAYLSTRVSPDPSVEVSEGDLSSALEKSGVAFQPLPPSPTSPQKVQFSGKKTLNTTFTDKELTALLNNKWKNNIIQDGQIKIHPDGTQELSGVLRMERLPGFLRALGTQEAAIQTLQQNLAFIKNDPPFDLRIKSSWANNHLATNIQSLEVGRIPIPQSIIKPYEPQIQSAFEKFILEIPGVSISKLMFSNGAMTTEGTVPSVVSWPQ